MTKAQLEKQLKEAKEKLKTASTGDADLLEEISFLKSEIADLKKGNQDLRNALATAEKQLQSNMKKSEAYDSLNRRIGKETIESLKHKAEIYDQIVLKEQHEAAIAQLEADIYIEKTMVKMNVHRN
jgi:predicted  nucleic acid-binding Zn-ribbon protein